MVLIPRIPEPLIYWEGERKIYGVLIREGVKVTGENYHLFHNDKVLNLIERDPDPETVFENMIPGWQRIGEKSPRKLFDRLQGNGGTYWMGHRTMVSLYLRNQVSLKDHLLLGKKEPRPSLHEFRKELMQLTLWEYLEMVTI